MVWQNMEPWQLHMLAGLALVALLLIAVLVAVARRGASDRHALHEIEDELDEGFRAMQAVLSQQSLGQREEQLRALQAIGDSLAGLINRGTDMQNSLFGAW